MIEFTTSPDVIRITSPNLRTTAYYTKIGIIRITPQSYDDRNSIDLIIIGMTSHNPEITEFLLILT